MFEERKPHTEAHVIPPHEVAMLKETREDREEIKRLKRLIVDMGSVIRRLDADHQYLELWTQDGGYLTAQWWT